MNEKFKAFWTEHKTEVLTAGLAIGTYILGVGVGAKLMRKYGTPVNVAVFIPSANGENSNS